MIVLSAKIRSFDRRSDGYYYVGPVTVNSLIEVIDEDESVEVWIDNDLHNLIRVRIVPVEGSVGHNPVLGGEYVRFVLQNELLVNSQKVH